MSPCGVWERTPWQDGHGKEVPQEDKAAAEVGKAKTEVKTTEEDVDLDDVDTSNMTT